MLRHKSVLVLLVSLAIAPCLAQQPEAASSPEGLGKIHFPNSCAQAAQSPFLKGIAQLHSFQYAAAEKAFTEVTQADAKCAMAYWGLAMSRYRPLWDGADDKALRKGRADLEKIQKDWPVSKREREYIDAIAIIFNYAHSSGDDRIAGYSRAMAEIAKHYPDDGEAQAFYALSLLALPNRGDDTELREKVIAILTAFCRRNPSIPAPSTTLFMPPIRLNWRPRG